MPLAPRTNTPRRPVAQTVFAVFSSLLIFFLAACNTTPKVTDPQLKPLEEMIQKELPVGSTQQQVVMFLNNRAYPTEHTAKEGTIVAIIRHIDTQKLQPVTARVIFYFDANNRLNTFEMQRTFNAPIPQSEIQPTPQQPAPQSTPPSLSPQQ
jgi:hypothetical protein